MVKHSSRLGKTIVKFWSVEGATSVAPGDLGARAGFRYVTAMVDSADVAAEQLAAARVAITLPPRDLGPARICFAADPDGNWVEFASMT